MKGIIIHMYGALRERLLSSQGNILVYIVLTMVIFGVLGVAMVSLFSTSISSTATQNDTRRATFLSEAGVRYAMSEMLSGNFSKATITDLNDNTEYTLNPAGKFKINVFSPWFEPDSNMDLGSTFSDQTRTFDVQEGNLPNGFINRLSTGAAGLALVNYDYINAASNPQPSAVAIVTGGAEVGGDPLKLQLTLDDDNDGGGFVANRNETVAFAVRPFSDLNNASLPVDLLVQSAAPRVFPARNGSIEIRKRNFYYDQAIDRGTHVELTNVRAVKDESASSLTVSTSDDYVILNPRNRYVISEGHSGDVYFGNHMNYAASIANILTQALSRKPDIDFTEEENLPSVLDLNVDPINSSFLGVDNTQKSIVISGSSGFGSVFFDDTRPIGGRTNFCVADTILENGLNRTGCLFERGIRVFFILNYNYQNLTNNDADGLTFSIINGTLNDSSSVGGDFQLSELLAYAGDSRLDNTSTPTFLDGRGEGIEPPKLAVEFDGRSNNATLSICSNATTVNENTRNDPGTDAVHYVFWGKNTSIDAPCRNNNKTYDDNRHDFVAQKWKYPPTGSISQVRSSPAIDPTDGTVYFGSGDPDTVGEALIYALDANGTPKSGWPYDPPNGSNNPPNPSNNDDDVEGDPVLDSSGNIYIGTDSNFLFSFNPDGTRRWPLGSPPLTSNLDGQVEGKPAIFGDRVYVNTEGRFYGFNKNDGTPLSGFPLAIGNTTSLQLSSPIVAPDGTIYVGSMDGNLYSISPTGNKTLILSTTGPILATPVRNPSSGDIYVAVRGILYGVSEGGAIYTFDAGGTDIVAAPAIAGTTVYVGSTNGRLYAIDTNTRTLKWRYPATGNLNSILSSPFIDPEGAIVFGASDGHLYAVKDKETRGELFWNFPENVSIGAVESSPVRNQNNGIIYFGSDDGHLYAVEPAFSNPRNLKNPYLNSTEIEAAVGDETNWLKSGPWAVRTEITRNNVQNANGNYDYTLRTWMRQCNANCANVLGTFYQDTRVEYQYAPSGVRVLEQLIELSPEDHSRFSRFIFGFTSATSVSQSISIDRFQLSFIRPNDPIISSDPSWP